MTRNFDIVEALAQLGGIATTADLTRATSRHTLTTAHASNLIIKAGHGLWMLPDLPDPSLARRAAMGLRGVVSHESAALHWELWVKNKPTRPIVTVPRNRTVPAKRRVGVDVRFEDVSADTLRAGVPDPLETAIAIARRAPIDEALPVADSGLRNQHFTKTALLQAAAASPRTGRAAAMRVAREASNRSESVFESVVRGISLDVPGVRLMPNVQVAPYVWADLVDPDLRLIVECDSWTFHSEKWKFEEDMSRYNNLLPRGWQVARFAWSHAWRQPEYIRWLLGEMTHHPYRQPLVI